MNSFSYTEALLYDKRNFCEYYLSLLKIKNPILFAFCPYKDYNSRIIKICIFILSFDINYAINFVFFIHQKIIHKIYENQGKYDIKYFLIFIVISFAFSHFITIIIKLVFLSDSNILEIKRQKQIILIHSISSRIRKKLKLKYAIFFILGIIFLFFFWISLSSFGALYNNTQIFVIKNTLISFALSLIYPILYNVLPCIFRMISINSKNLGSIYNIGKFLQHL